MEKQIIKTNTNALRFDPETLRKIAGEKIFARGAAYHKEGAVEIVSLEQSRVRARILGSELYEAELKLVNSKISGSCSCPADRDFGFCKHLVATALTVNDLRPGAVKQTKSRMEIIRDYVREMDKGTMAALLINQAESDPTFFKGLELGMKVAKGKTADIFEEIKKAITQATATHGYVDYDEAPGWIIKLEKTIAQIAPLANTSPDVALNLLDYFFDRMEKALEEVDHHHDRAAGKVCEKAAEMYRQACRTVKTDPEDLAARLFQREMETSWDFFSGVCEDYREILGEKGLTTYHRLAKEAWDKLSSLNPSREHYDTNSTQRYALKSILDRLAKGEGDLDTRIALRAKDLSSAEHYLELAVLCLDHEREDEALK
ncbi:MAG: SWIM zinc finger family protein [Alphaproteobacteria bacterium]